MKYNTDLIIHMGDNSSYPVKRTNFTKEGGWKEQIDSWVVPVVEQYGLKHFFMRQPFPTPHIINDDGQPIPMWFTGYLWAQKNKLPLLWNTFVSDWKEFQKNHPDVTLWFYAGHPGDDTNYGVTRERTPWAPDPLLEKAWENDMNAYVGIWDKCMTPFMEVPGSNVILDASSRVLPDSKTGVMLRCYHDLFKLKGREFGVESPPSHPDFKDFAGCAVWGVYRGAKSIGIWEETKGSRLVMCMPSKEEADGVAGDIGGWNRKTHELVTQRIKEVIAGGDYAVINLMAAKRAGFKSIDEYLDYNFSDSVIDSVVDSVTHYPGDVNDDGFVGIADMNAINSHWNENVDSRAKGDLTGDGYVGMEDLSEVLANWNTQYNT